MLIARRSPAGMIDSIEGGNAMPAGPRAGSTRLCSRGMASRITLAREARSEEHTSELQSLMRISSAVFCLKKKNRHKMHLPATRNEQFTYNTSQTHIEHAKTFTNTT